MPGVTVDVTDGLEPSGGFGLISIPAWASSVTVIVVVGALTPGAPEEVWMPEFMPLVFCAIDPPSAAA